MARKKEDIQCEKCGKQFRQKNGLQGHMRFVHGTGPGGSAMLSEIEKDIQELLRLKELRQDLETRAGEGYMGLPKDPHIDAMIRRVDDRMDEIAGILKPEKGSRKKKSKSLVSLE